MIKPLASSAVHPFCISPYSPNLVFTRSSFDSTPTVENESGRSSKIAVPLHYAETPATLPQYRALPVPDTDFHARTFRTNWQPGLSNIAATCSTYIFKETMGTDNQHRSSSLESYTPFDTDNGIPNVHVAADTVGRTDLLHFLNSLDRIIKLLVINSFQFTFSNVRRSCSLPSLVTCFK